MVGVKRLIHELISIDDSNKNKTNDEVENVKWINSLLNLLIILFFFLS